MSVQDKLEVLLNNMNEEELREALTDFILPLTSYVKSDKEKIDMIKEIYEERIVSKMNK